MQSGEVVWVVNNSLPYGWRGDAAEETEEPAAYMPVPFLSSVCSVLQPFSLYNSVASHIIFCCQFLFSDYCIISFDDRP